jgi:hypothetical protein|tara:strand:- start:62 stop:295 length:234 start_codon:yes stop_codon:yes gene_type:complete
MRSLNLNEEEFKALREYINITLKDYTDAFYDGKIKFENYNKVDKILSRFHNLPKVKIRYDKTKTQGYKERLCQKKEK